MGSLGSTPAARSANSSDAAREKTEVTIFQQRSLQPSVFKLLEAPDHAYEIALAGTKLLGLRIDRMHIIKCPLGIKNQRLDRHFAYLFMDLAESVNPPVLASR
jgi:hypothetical protein